MHWDYLYSSYHLLRLESNSICENCLFHYWIANRSVLTDKNFPYTHLDQKKEYSVRLTQFLITTTTTSTTMDHCNSSGHERIKIFMSFFHCGARACQLDWSANQENALLVEMECRRCGSITPAYSFVSCPSFKDSAFFF